MLIFSYWGVFAFHIFFFWGGPRIRSQSGWIWAEHTSDPLRTASCDWHGNTTSRPTKSTKRRTLCTMLTWVAPPTSLDLFPLCVKYRFVTSFLQYSMLIGQKSVTSHLYHYMTSYSIWNIHRLAIHRWHHICNIHESAKEQWHHSYSVACGLDKNTWRHTLPCHS